MGKRVDPLLEHLKVLRNLCTSAYGKLANGGSLREELNDSDASHRLYELVYKVRSRFDSYKVLLQSLQPGSSSDGALALAQSLIVHISMIRELLERVGVYEQSRPYASVCEPVIVDLFNDAEFKKSPPSEKLLRVSIRLPNLLNAIAPAVVAYWFVICIV